jgi:hypothetical protein
LLFPDTPTVYQQDELNDIAAENKVAVAVKANIQDIPKL